MPSSPQPAWSFCVEGLEQMPPRLSRRRCAVRPPPSCEHPQLDDQRLAGLGNEAEQGRPDNG